MFVRRSHLHDGNYFTGNTAFYIGTDPCFTDTWRPDQMSVGQEQFKSMQIDFEISPAAANWFPCSYIQTLFKSSCLLKIKSLQWCHVASIGLFVQQLILANNKHKALQYWPFVREFPDDGGFCSQRASNAENISKSWHHGADSRFVPGQWEMV